MLKIEVPENDQAIYEIKTVSGSTLFVRCPGTDTTKTAAGFLAFLVEPSGERLVVIHDLEKIVAFTRRADLPLPDQAQRVRSVSDLLFANRDRPAQCFLHKHLS